VCRGHDQIISRTKSLAAVVAILMRLGSPRTSDSANLVAWSRVILGGRGGSFASTSASTTTGPGVRRASSTAMPVAIAGHAGRNCSSPKVTLSPPRLA
jgi:hypothetical protein